MNAGKRIILILCMVAIVAVSAVYVGWRSASARAELDTLSRQLAAEDAFDRLSAAEGMLALDRGRGDARLAAAEALNVMGRFGRARQLLEPTIAPGKGAVFHRAVQLYLDACLGEAEELIATVQTHAVDLTATQVDGLLERAGALSEQLDRSDAAQHAWATLSEARRENCRASILHLQLDKESQQLAKVRAVDAESRDQLAAVGASDIAARYAKARQSAETLCAKAMEYPATAPMARLLEIRMALREGDYTKARAAAAALSTQPVMSRAVAGEAAGILVNLETANAQLVTASDRACAAAILHHAGLTGAATLRFEMADAELALHEGDLERTRRQTRRVISRYPGHPDATALLAQTFVREGKPDQALALILPLNDRVRFAQGKYVEAQARVAAGSPGRGLELLREALDLDSRHLPARLLLAEMVASTGQIIGAARDIVVAVEINPDHPRVMALHARLMVEQEDHAELAGRLIQYFRTRKPRSIDVVLAANMVLDDVVRVADMSKPVSQAGGSGDLVMLLAAGWSRAAPQRRMEVAALISQVLRDALDADPLRWPDPPSPPALVWRLNQGESTSELAANRFIASPSETAAAMVEVAQEQWAAENDWPALLRALRWSDLESDAAPWSPQQIAAHLHAHPWSDGPLLATMRRHVRAGDEPAARKLVETAKAINPKLALLAQCRLNLELGLVSNALHDATMVTRGETTGSSIRMIGAELGARANLANGSAELAVGLIENLALSAPCGPVEMKLASADVLMWAHRDSESAAALVSLLNDPAVPPRWLDHVLIRAATVLGPKRLDQALTDRMAAGDSTPILRAYKAWCRASLGDLVAANEQIDLAEKDSPNSARLLMLRAGLHQAEGKTDAALDIYRALLAREGRTALAARREMDRLTRSAAGRSEP